MSDGMAVTVNLVHVTTLCKGELEKCIQCICDEIAW